MFVEDIEPDERSPIDFSTPLASSPPIRNRDFREPGESSRGAQENNQIMEMLISIQKSMEEREKKWSLQQKFREEVCRPSILLLNTCIYPIGVTLTHRSHITPLGPF